ncbi:gamma-glutamyltransferase [Sulfidibacter corallicola]|uniref:Glutathione hydrolase proenzyme n=1 Tax=Sulfidibacter corallicola TaxID=2818388 RepID=A0A8A4TQZ2_SULCO|nr:gamma-glutamyltransferase [Sulfidibacter corallicola]QTD51428.1 gamma-glutamyltransferase [Sulfidibacter corallicola]
MRRFFSLFCRILLGTSVATGTGMFGQVDRITGRSFATRSEVIAPHGMVATSQPLATQVGLDVLKAGGSAVDAAIAANAALGLMEPTGCGIGGDLFAIVWDASEKKLYGLNASGRSPLGLSLERLKQELATLDRTDIPPYGMLPISVPGAVSGWQELHAKFGRLPLEQVLEPAIEYAEKGFPVSELIAYYWQRSVPRLRDQPGAFEATFTIDGKAPQKGQIFRNPDLANTYRILAKEGPQAFYRGSLAEKIDVFFKANGGFLRKRDLERHKSTWVEPLSVDYRGYTVYELPPNGQGIAALQMLNILEEYDLAAMGHNSPQFLHLMVETKKLVFEDRARFYSDPEFNKLPIQNLLSKAYAAERRALINPKRAARRVAAGNPALKAGDTIYLTTADKEGNMVSLIQSNYRGMGSGVVVPGLGFVFQDRGQLFALETDHFNVYAPGKRPFHTIIPAFVLKEGKPFLSFGVMGGAMQPQGHVQILVNIIDFGMNLQEAGDAARWQHFGSSSPTGTTMTSGGFVELESAIPWQTVRALRRLGHDVRHGMGGFGGYQAIGYDAKSGVYFGASESRKDGHAAGY